MTKLVIKRGERKSPTHHAPGSAEKVILKATNYLVLLKWFIVCRLKHVRLPAPGEAVGFGGGGLLLHLVGPLG